MQHFPVVANELSGGGPAPPTLDAKSLAHLEEFTQAAQRRGSVKELAREFSEKAKRGSASSDAKRRGSCFSDATESRRGSAVSDCSSVSYIEADASVEKARELREGKLDECRSLLAQRSDNVKAIASTFSGGSKQETIESSNRRLQEQERAYRQKVCEHIRCPVMMIAVTYTS
jgi:adenylosuccinate synthase